MLFNNSTQRKQAHRKIELVPRMEQEELEHPKLSYKQMIQHYGHQQGAPGEREESHCQQDQKGPGSRI